MQGRPDLVLRVVLTAFDDVADDVHGAPELPAPRRDVDEPVVLPVVPRVPPCDVPVLLREPLDDPRGITRGSIRGVDPVS